MVNLILFSSFSFLLEVETGVPDYGKRRHTHIVRLIHYLIVQWLSRESGVETKVELSAYIQEIFIEGVQDLVRIPSISFSTMEKE